MVQLESVSGNSVAEYFYNAVGWACFGLAALTLMAALPRRYP